MKGETKILVVDDEEGIRDWLLFELEGQGYTVAVARDGLEAIEKVKNSKFDIAIVDIKMPGMDGIEVLEEIKKIEPYIEVIISTGYGTIELAIESIRKGACDFITKPNSVEEITIVIEKAIEKQKLKETIAIYEMSRDLISNLETDRLLKLSISLAMKALKSDGAALLMHNKEQKLYASSAFSSTDADMNIAMRAVNQRRPQLFNGNSSLAVPLIEQDEVLGVLFVKRVKEAGHFTENDLNKAVLFASQVALAFNNANLYARLNNSSNSQVKNM